MLVSPLTALFATKRINKSSKIITVIVIINLCFIVTSCKKFLDIGSPKNELVTETVFNNSSTANSAILGLYSKIINDNSITYKIPLYTGLSSDELVNYSNLNDITDFYINNVSAVNSNVTEFWNTCYNYIFQANSMIEGLQSTKSLPMNLVNQLRGEAYFIRSFWYFYLVNLYGDVPLIISTNYKLNSTTRRTSSAEVYKKITEDLKLSQSLLVDDYVGVDGVTPTDERVRVNKGAATALLARIYLYTKEYTKAEEESTKLIANISTYQLLSNLDQVFQKNNEECIWSLQTSPDVSGYNTPEGYGFILLDAPESSRDRCSSLSPSLLSSFEAGDKRKESWVGELNGISFAYKYKVSTSSDLMEYSVALRLSEQFLIRSEARVYNNDILGAQHDLNIVRNRAGLSDTEAVDGPSLLLAIQKERRIEFFCEWGHRWLDLKRTEAANSIMPEIATLKGGTWHEYDILYPIPDIERMRNPNLTQNAGY